MIRRSLLGVLAACAMTVAAAPALAQVCRT